MTEKELMKVVKEYGGVAVHYIGNIYNVILPNVHGEYWLLLADGSDWKPETSFKVIRVPRKKPQGTQTGITLAVRDAAGLRRALEWIKKDGGYDDDAA